MPEFDPQQLDAALEKLYSGKGDPGEVLLHASNQAWFELVSMLRGEDPGLKKFAIQTVLELKFRGRPPKDPEKKPQAGAVAGNIFEVVEELNKKLVGVKKKKRAGDDRATT